MQLFGISLNLVWLLSLGVVVGGVRFVSKFGGQRWRGGLSLIFLTCVKRWWGRNGFISMRYICHE